MSVVFASWDVQLYNSELHSMVAPESFLTIAVLILTAFCGYAVIRFVPPERRPPLVSAVCIAAVYIGIAICVVWSVQCLAHTNLFFLIILPVNCILIFVKAVLILVYNKNRAIQNNSENIKHNKLTKILNNAMNLPWIALLFVLPLLGIIVAVLLLFGQEPDSAVKAWIKTADWAFSQETPPQNIYRDEHYLCTVAAGGHKSVVKPIRVGLRHGHRVVVNRQLCIANAFEQVLEERTPAIHKVIRGIYDGAGYPLAKRINSKYTADTIYFIMKPLEWLFLIVLYFVDTKPENRIALQYPHSKKPDCI